MLSLIITVVAIIVLPGNYADKNVYDFVTEKTVLREISVAESYNKMVFSEREKFDLNSILTGDNSKYNIFFFKGKVVDIKSYEVSWTDENNEVWGPFLRNIISVQLEDVYTDSVLTGKKTIRVLTTEPLNFVNDKSVEIKIGESFVFLNCWALDDKYFNQVSQQSQSGKIYDTSLQMADVIIGRRWNSIFPIVNDSVLIYNEYFSNVTDISKNALLSTNSNFDEFINSKSDFIEDYIVVNMSDFEKSIDNLIKTANKTNNVLE